MPNIKNPADYIRTHIENDTYTYNDCYNHQELMDHHVKLCMRRGYKNPSNGPLFYPKCLDHQVFVEPHTH